MMLIQHHKASEYRDRAIEFSAGTAPRPKGMTPEQSGEQLVRAIERRKRELVSPFSLRLALALDAVFPSLVDRIIRAKAPLPPPS